MNNKKEVPKTETSIEKEIRKKHIAIRNLQLKKYKKLDEKSFRELVYSI